MDTETFRLYVGDIRTLVDSVLAMNPEDEADFPQLLINLHIIQLDAEDAADMLRDFHNAENGRDE